MVKLSERGNQTWTLAQGGKKAQGNRPGGGVWGPERGRYPGGGAGHEGGRGRGRAAPAWPWRQRRWRKGSRSSSGDVPAPLLPRLQHLGKIPAAACAAQIRLMERQGLGLRPGGSSSRAWMELGWVLERLKPRLPGLPCSPRSQGAAVGAGGVARSAGPPAVPPGLPELVPARSFPGTVAANRELDVRLGGRHRSRQA